MKKSFLLLLITITASVFGQCTPQAIVSPQQPIANYNDWITVISNDFNSSVTVATSATNLFGNTVNESGQIGTGWRISHAENAEHRKNVFLNNQVVLGSDSGVNYLSLKAEACPSGGCMRPSGCPTPLVYRDGNGCPAVYMGGEIISDQKIMYGCVEGRIKFPTGQGMFPAFWLFPKYREREFTAADSCTFKFRQNDYPEEIDILEQRSVLPSQGSYIYDFNSYYDSIPGNSNLDISAVSQQDFQDSTLAGNFHTYKVKWNLFGIYFYIDNDLRYTYNLWKRRTNTESMNVVITNMTNNWRPVLPNINWRIDNVLCTAPNSITEATYTIDTPPTPHGNLDVDYVKVYQEKKIGNRMVWASGKSDRIGDFNLSEDQTALDVFIPGNFIDKEDTPDGDELFIFSRNGLKSVLTKFTHKKSMYLEDRLNACYSLGCYSIGKEEEDVWDVNYIDKEERATLDSSYTMNNWFTPTNVANTKYVVGNFDANTAQDELFLSNKQTGYSIVTQFSQVDPDIIRDGHYDFWELYNNGAEFDDGLQPLIKSYNAAKTVEYKWGTSSNDVFVAGDLNGDGTDELLCINTSTRKNSILQLMVSNQSGSAGNYWLNLMNSVGGTKTNIGSWIISSNDKYFLDNFYVTDSEEELICINTSTRLVHVYKWNVSTTSWTKIWGNDTTNPKTIANWVYNANDQFLGGSFLNEIDASYTHPAAQLLCISNDQHWQEILQLQKSGATYSWVAVQGSENPSAPAFRNMYQYLKYNFKYNGPNKDKINSTLLSIERFRNPDHSTCTADVTGASGYNCWKYLSSLVSFIDNPTASKQAGASIMANSNDDIFKNNESLIISPNPSNGNFSIDLKQQSTGEYQIFDEKGLLIKKDKFTNTDKIDIQISGKLAIGIYVLKVSVGSEIISKKIIISN